MNNQEIKNLCLSLVKADYQSEVIEILKKAGYWDNPDAWRYYGGKENNSGSVRGQQAEPDSALVEKIINSIDACLINECRERKIDPEDPSEAPSNLHDAVATFYDSDRKDSTFAGIIGSWDKTKRTRIARNITLCATGAKPREGNPCFTITDSGEGQTPDMFPKTFLSFAESNKIRIHFVQGLYNMGGAGVLRFCGNNKLQLIVSRRNPKFTGNNGDSGSADHCWGFTIVRREPPKEGRKSSVYTYLAPYDIDAETKEGGVLRFEADSLPVVPDKNIPYTKDLNKGTLIKLYEYTTNNKQSMFMKGGIKRNLDLRLPDLALPVRLHECRAFGGHKGSYELTLTGIGVRLDDDRQDNIEDEFPTTTVMKVMGQKMTAKVYAFKKGKSVAYKTSEGVLFTVNGQTQGQLSDTFFTKGNLNYHRIKKSLLVVVDCTRFDETGREDFFMSQRDRLSKEPIRKEVEEALLKHLKDHTGIRSLLDRRRQEDLEDKLAEDKPLANVLDSIIKQSPSLASLFLLGQRMSAPFKSKSVTSIEEKFKGKPHPTFFKFKGKEYGKTINRDCHINQRSRIIFETDVVNDYFDRSIDQGDFNLYVVENGAQIEASDFVGPNLINGIASLNVKLPNNAKVGDTYEYVAVVTDPIRNDPFENRFKIKVLIEALPKEKQKSTRRKPPSDEKGKDRETQLKLSIPYINEIKEEAWDNQEPKFTPYTALRIIPTPGDDDSKTVYDFNINVDNHYLKDELKKTKLEPRLVKARFKYGMVLLGLSMLYDYKESKKHKKNNEDDDNDENTLSIEDKVEEFTKATAPVLLPMIASLGVLTDEDVMVELSEEED